MPLMNKASGCKEEQEIELEALRMIFLDDLTEIHAKNNKNLQFQIRLCQSLGNSNTFDNCILQFSLPNDYPFTTPIMTIISDKMSNRQKEQMLNVLELEAKKNMGSPMIYDLITMVQDWWHLDNERQIKQDDEEKLIKETERYKRIDGTPVSPETFMEWKRLFDEERLSKRKNDNFEEEKRLTGKQIFEKNSMMNISDQIFLEDEEFLENIDETKCAQLDEVDQSLFEDIDDEIENLELI